MVDVSAQAHQEAVHLGGRPQIQGRHQHPPGERDRLDRDRSLELDGARSEVGAAIKWLEKNGVNIETVEINVIES